MFASGRPFLQIALKKYSQASRMPEFQRTLTKLQKFYFFAGPLVSLALSWPLPRPFFLFIYPFPYLFSHLFSFNLSYSSLNLLYDFFFIFLIKIKIYYLLDYSIMVKSTVALDLSKVENYFGNKQRIVSTYFYALYYILFFVIMALIAYSIFTLNYYLIAAFIIMFIIQLPLGRSQTYVRILTRYIMPFKYFKNFKIIYDQEVPKDQKCLFGVHPHSVYGNGLIMTMNSSQTGPFAKLVGLSSRFALNTPVLGVILKAWGLQAVNNSNMKRLMKQGKNIGLFPGGFEEATITTPNEMRIWIKNRKGFIKYSLENDYTIHPIMVLNEHQAFSTFDYFIKFRLWLNKLKLPAAAFWNIFTGPMMPPIQMQVIVGKGIKGQLSKDRDLKEVIEEVHKRYVEEIERIYTKYQKLNGNKPLKWY